MTTDTAQLRELLAKATPGLWGYDSRPGTACHIWVPATKLTMVDGELAYKGSREDIADLRTGTREEDAALIVEAVNALPSLLDRLEAAEKALEFYGSEWEQDVDAERTACGWQGSIGDAYPTEALCCDRGDKARAALHPSRDEKEGEDGQA